MDKDNARQQVGALVEQFRNLSPNDLKGYTEEETKKDYLLPLFRALGWDVEQRSEVRAEEKVADGYPDYSFRLNGVPVFFLEAKKIREPLTKKYMMQAINYSYLKGVTWAVLSDFEEMMVFNAEWEEKDPFKARFLNMRYDQYTEDRYFDLLWLLSKEAMQTRDIDGEAETHGKKKTKDPVTKVLFAQLTDWRRGLFKEINQYGETLWSRDAQKVDEAIQRFLDRLIFIRTVEDRRVEGNQLLAVLRQYEQKRGKDKNLFRDILALFREMDTIYNARLFAPHTLDHLTLYNENLLSDIIKGLYDVKGGFATFDFAAIDADVLGAVYEQYLGFKALDPKGEQAIDLGKQTKRKSQGIFYTPQFVVRYIVRQTLGKLLEAPDMTPEKAHNLRILDPACGSGSFLIEAFDVLDRWLAQNGTPEDKQFPRRRRLRILRENIYGVDLDPQAVEVAQLNLLLRAAYEREKLDLLNHIKHGNSLIDDPEVAGESAFKWEDKFPEVMAAGGFDVVVGNPPYIRVQTLPSEQVGWIGTRYKSATGSYDIYIPFVERGLSILNQHGLMGYILPHKFFNAQYGKNLRQLIAEGKHLTEVVHFGDQQIFEGASTYTCIMTLSKRPCETFDFVQVQNVQKWIDGNGSLKGSLLADKAKSNEWNFVISHGTSLFDRLNAIPVKLQDVTSRIFQGIKTSADKIYIVNEIKRESDTIKVYSEAKNLEYLLEPDLLHPLVKGGDSKSYLLEPTNRLILFPYARQTNGSVGLIPESSLKTNYPLTWAYFQENKEYLENRENKKMKGERWYAYGRTQALEVMTLPKIFTPDIAPRSAFSLDATGELFFTGGTAGGYGVLVLPNYSREYILGLLNSKLLEWFLHQMSTSLRGGWFSYEAKFIRHLPICSINLDDPADKARHDKMVSLVEKMLQLKRDYAAAAATLDDKRHDLAEQIARTDNEIDALVYELYGLTDDEIAIIEGH